MAGTFLLSAAAPAPVRISAGDDAVAYQMNPAHSGNDGLDTGFSPPLQRAWAYDFRTESLLSPLIAQGLVIAEEGEDAARFFALDLGTGKLVWTTPEISGVAFDPAYDNGRLFVMSYNSGDLLAYDAATGKQQWSEHIEFVGADPPTAAGGQVFLVAGPYTGTVYAVDETTGNINWTQQVDGAALSGDNPAYDGGSLYVSYACNYYKLDAATGMIDWNTTGVDSCEGNTGLPPVYYAGRVFMAESSGADYLLNANTGKIYGSYAVGWGTSPAFFTRNGEYYGLSVVQGILYCFRVSTGDVVWSFTHKGGVITSPIVVNNFVAVSVDYPTSRIYILNSATGKSLWSAPGAAQILVAGDDTLIAESDGVITAYAPRNAGRDALPKLR